MGYSTVIQDLLSVQLSLIGISFSIFTILYSLITSKLELLNTISKNIKEGNHSPDLLQTENFCIKNINRLKRMNFWSILVCISSILLLFFLWLAKLFTLPKITLSIIIVANCIDFVGIFILICFVFYSYFRTAKFD